MKAQQQHYGWLEVGVVIAIQSVEHVSKYSTCIWYLQKIESGQVNDV